MGNEQEQDEAVMRKQHENRITARRQAEASVFATTKNGMKRIKPKSDDLGIYKNCSIVLIRA